MSFDPKRKFQVLGEFNSSKPFERLTGFDPSRDFENLDVKRIIKPSPKKELGQQDIVDIVLRELKMIPKTKPVERIIEKQIVREIREAPKEKDKEILELRTEIKNLNDALEKLKRAIPFLVHGGSGVIGIPNPEGQNGKILTVVDNHAVWQLISISSSHVSADVYLTTNVTTTQSYDALSTSMDQIANVLGSLIISLQAGGIIQISTGSSGISLSGYSISNLTTTHSFDAASTSLDQIANVLGSLITSLKNAVGGVSSDAYSVSNLTTDRAFDATSTSLDELANVLGSLITSLKGAGILQ